MTVRREAAEADAAPRRHGDAQAECGTRCADRLTDALYGLGWGTVKKLPEPVGRGARPHHRGHRVEAARQERAAAGVQSRPRRARRRARAARRAVQGRYALVHAVLDGVLPAAHLERRSASATSVEIQDAHHLTDGIASGRGVILALPHLANWDLAGVWVTRSSGSRSPRSPSGSSRRPSTTASSPTARASAWRCCRTPAAPPSARWPGGCAPAAWSAWSPTVICRPPGVEVKFFGETARMPAGPALLAQQTGALLLPVTLWYDERRSCRAGSTRPSRCPRQVPGPRRRPP